jgi:transposase
MKKIEFRLRDSHILEDITKTGKRNAHEFEGAYILLALGKGKHLEDIQDYFNVSRITIWRIKKNYLKDGIDRAIQDKPRSGQPAKYNDKTKADIIALGCWDAPAGRSRWTYDYSKRH